MRVRAGAAGWRCREAGGRWIDSARNGLRRGLDQLAGTRGFGEHDFRLVHVVTLHVADAELEQYGHRVRVLDALGDRRDPALVRGLDVAAHALPQRLVARQAL